MWMCYLSPLSSHYYADIVLRHHLSCILVMAKASKRVMLCVYHGTLRIIMVDSLYIWSQFFISISRNIHLFMWRSNFVVVLYLLRSFLSVLYKIRHWWVRFSVKMMRYFMYSASLALHIFWIVISYVMKQCVKRNKCFQ